MKKPNFFIIGAPKCGTTALAQYLSEHPDIFISTPKEPHYFLDPVVKERMIIDKQHYLSLFKGSKEKKWVGEASVWYLYSNYARKAIKAFNPEAKIIVMKRNPVDFVASLHSQMVFGLFDLEKNFEKSWSKNKHRICSQEKTTIEQEENWRLMYGELMQHDKYISQYIADFGRENIFIIEQEKMLKDTHKTYIEALDFLRVKDDGRIDFLKVNVNKVHKSSFFREVLHFFKRQHWSIKTIRRIKSFFGVGTFGLYRFFRDLNLTEGDRPQISERIKKDILKHFNSKLH